MNIVHKEGEKEELRHTRVHKQDLNHLTTVTDRQSVDASVTVAVYETQSLRKKEQRKKAKQKKIDGGDNACYHFNENISSRKICIKKRRSQL